MFGLVAVLGLYGYTFGDRDFWRYWRDYRVVSPKFGETNTRWKAFKYALRKRIKQ